MHHNASHRQMHTSGDPKTPSYSVNAILASEAQSVQSLSYNNSCNTASHPCQEDVSFISNTVRNPTHRSCTLPGSNVVRHDAHFKQGLCHLFPIALTYDPNPIQIRSQRPFRFVQGCATYPFCEVHRLPAPCTPFIPTWTGARRHDRFRAVRRGCE